MTRIAHVIPCFLPSSETFIYTQLQAQATLEQVVVTRQTANRERFPYQHVYDSSQLESSPRRERLARKARLLAHRANIYQRLIIAVARDHRSQVLHAHFGWSGVEAVLPAARLDIPLVTAFHGSDVYVEPWHDHVTHQYRDLFRSGAVFTCVGPRAGDELVRRGCPRERLRIVPVGIDLASFPYRETAPDGPFTVVQVSRLTAKKGIDLTLKAFADVRRTIPDAQLWLVGEGSERDELVTLSKRLGIADCVTFHGAVAHDKIQELMRMAHVGIQPSRVAPNGDQEGTPTVLLEFQAAGVDVVATRHADIPSIVAAPDALVPEGDAASLTRAIVHSATRSDAARRERAAAARAYVEQRHDAARVAVQLAEVYREAGELGGQPRLCVLPRS